MTKEQQKMEMEKLIERRLQAHRWDISYGELVESEKRRLETKMGDIVEKYPELEELIPSPICWR